MGNHGFGARVWRLIIVAPILLTITLAAGCGRKRAFDRGDELSPAVLGGAGGTRVETGAQTTTEPGIPAPPTAVRPPRPVYQIVPVTQIVPATSGIPGWGPADLPLNGPAVGIGDPVLNGQTPFSFDYDFPQNNYQFVDAHLVIDTSRDSSDTEGIQIDGVFSGRPPLADVNMTATGTTERIYFGSGAPELNTYYIDWSLAHYKINTRNSFDLLLSDLLDKSDLETIDALKDNVLEVVTGDDSPVYQAFLVIKGRTISTDALSCATSDTYTFTNMFLHNDGNTLAQAAFVGDVTSPVTSWAGAAGTYDAVEFHFDPSLPKVDLENITLTNARLMLRLRRVPGATALIVNGHGASETGFDRGTADPGVVESWDDAATAAWEAAMAPVPTDGTTNGDIQVDLITLFGALKVRELLGQGKLNVSLAGPVKVYASAATVGRGFAAAVNGPELSLDGTYFTEVCTVPNDPDSPLTQDGIVLPPEEEEEAAGGGGTGGTVVVTNDGAGPVMSSVQATEITSNAATILWLTDEPASTQVLYGIGNVASQTPRNATLTTYHQVRLTGLIPYKYYNFQVVSDDKFGNRSTSGVTVFVTLR